MKRFITRLLLLTVLCAFCFGFSVSAASETYSIPEIDITVSIPSDYLVLLRSDETLKTDPVTSALFEGSNAALVAICTDATHMISISSEASALEDLDGLGEENIKYFVDGQALRMELEGAEVLKKEVFSHSKTAFSKICFRIPESNVYGISYYTAVNSTEICIMVQTEGVAITDVQEATADVIVSSIKLGEKYGISTSYTASGNVAASDSDDAGKSTTQSGKKENTSNSASSYTTGRTAVSGNDYDKMADEFVDRVNEGRKTTALVQSTKPSALEKGLYGAIAAAVLGGIYALFRWLKNKIFGSEDTVTVGKTTAASATWECRLCGTTNEAHYKKCQNCGSERYPGSAGTRSAASAAVGTWQCGNCGTENKNNYSQCKKCGTYRSQS